MLFSLTSSTKKYTCEVCSETPETFLTSIVAGICNATDTKERVIADNRVDVLEHKVNKIMVSLEKFDLQTVTDNLSMLGNKMEQANNNLTGNVKAMQKMKKDQEDSTTEFTTGKEHTYSDNELEQVKKALEQTQKELKASQSSNELLMETVTQRDASIAALRGKVEKNQGNHNEWNRRLTFLEVEKKQLQESITVVSNEKIAAITMVDESPYSEPRKRPVCTETGPNSK